jgi:hypothetical protein
MDPGLAGLTPFINVSISQKIGFNKVQNMHSWNLCLATLSFLNLSRLEMALKSNLESVQQVNKAISNKVEAVYMWEPCTRRSTTLLKF